MAAIAAAGTLDPVAWRAFAPWPVATVSKGQKNRGAPRQGEADRLGHIG
jgi:hypothetical protein